MSSVFRFAIVLAAVSLLNQATELSLEAQDNAVPAVPEKKITKDEMAPFKLNLPLAASAIIRWNCSRLAVLSPLVPVNLPEPIVPSVSAEQIRAIVRAARRREIASYS